MVRSKLVFYVIPPGEAPNLRKMITQVTKKAGFQDMKNTVYVSADNVSCAYTTPGGVERYAKRAGKTAKYVLV